MTKFGILVVEGPHDTKLIRRLLRAIGFDPIRMLDQVDDFFNPKMIPDYPPNGDIEVRVPIPSFFRGQDHFIAVQEAGGDSQLVNQLRNLAAVYDLDDFVGVGVLLDKDLELTVAQRFQSISNGFSELGLPILSAAGKVSKGQPNCGVFILPDNKSDGALEDILLDIAAQTYPGLLKTAQRHVDTAISDLSLSRKDLEELVRVDGEIKHSGRKKAIIGTIASVLRPGRSIAASIQDNRWFRGSNLDRPDVKSLQNFLSELFDLHVTTMTPDTNN